MPLKRRYTAALTAGTLAVVIAGGTYLFMYKHLQGPPKLPVVVSTVPIHKGDKLSAADFTIQYMQQAQIPSGAIHIPSEVNGHIADEDIAKNAPLVISDVATTGVKAVIPAGLMAIGVPTDMVASSGVLNDGDFVDVYSTKKQVNEGNTGSSSNAALANLIATHVQVVKIESSTGGTVNVVGSSTPSSKQAGTPAAVTLAVTPTQAASIFGAESNGTIYLADDPYKVLNGAGQ